MVSTEAEKLGDKNGSERCLNLIKVIIVVGRLRYLFSYSTLLW